MLSKKTISTSLLWLILVSGLVPIIPGLGGGKNHVRAQKPNVIIVLSDDQGYGDFSIYGNPILETPVLDKLASESVQLTDFHVAPLCTPTRGQLLTGLDGLRNGASTVLMASNIVKREVTMMPEIFRDNGYATGIFGKWHLGDSYPDRPLDNGFEKSIWFKGWGLRSEAEFDNDYYETRYLDGLEQKYSGRYCTNLWFDEAMNWMTDMVSKDRPFFSYIALNAPHGPFDAQKQDFDVYKDQVEDEKTASFFGMIRNIDRGMGRVENWLEEQGIKENTILVFLTDNGTAQGEKVFNANMRGKKGSNYEGGHRTPCFIRWPNGKLTGLQNIQTPTQVQDLLPTLIGLAQLKGTDNLNFDGMSLSGMMKGNTPLKDRMFVVQHGGLRTAKKYDGSVIWNEWRLVGENELYNIEQDPSQQRNLSQAKPEVVAKMQAYYEEWWAGVNPEKQNLVPIMVGTPEENPVIVNSDNWEIGAINTQWKVASGDGEAKGGTIRIQVARQGKYKVELSRWPFHLNLPLRAEGILNTIGGTQIPKGKALPITGGRLRINNTERSLTLRQSNATSLSFEVELKEEQIDLQAWFVNQMDNPICGAYYVRFKKLD